MPDQLLGTIPKETREVEVRPAGARSSLPWWGWTALVLLVIAGGWGAVKVFQGIRASTQTAGLNSGGGVRLNNAPRTAALKAGMPAPGFDLRTLDGRTASLESYRGQVILLNFWATWCPPCRQEMPDMQQVYEERGGQGFTVVAVNVQEATEPVAGFVDRYGLTFPVLLDVQGDAVQQYAVFSLPSSFFIDREGRVAEVHAGPLSKAAINAKVDGLIR